MIALASVALDPGNLLLWLIAGGIAGFLTGRVMGGGFGFFGDIIMGLIGAVVGGFVAGLFMDASFGFWGTTLVATIGAIIVVALYRAVSGGSRAV